MLVRDVLLAWFLIRLLRNLRYIMNFKNRLFFSLFLCALQEDKKSGQMLIEIALAACISRYCVLCPMLSVDVKTLRTVGLRTDHERRLLEAEQFLATQHRLQQEDAKQATVAERI